ncbi:hypothetical protein cand_010480 [Cryptosporidium andersoni]|uniref:Uncharacterized protein n=1 Tax=Cryptosporidium andersoni TaxID=117008 RepID=A0A1J4MPV5_9CRYT|nr:hypothetical protein cand_010480 [Cryptosporidium andersoni]
MLDSIENYKDYFPSFVKENYEQETTLHLDRLIYLIENYKSLLEGYGKLAELIRLASKFIELSYRDYISRFIRVQIIKGLWIIFSDENVILGIRLRISGILVSHIRNYKKLYSRNWWENPYIIKTENPDFFLSCENDTLMRNVIDCEVICEMIESEYTCYLETASMSSSKRRDKISSVIKILAAYRSFISMETLENLLNKWLSLDTKHTSFFIYSRIFLASCSPQFAYKLVTSQRLFKIWGLVNRQIVGTWDSVMVALLSRAVKYSWYKRDDNEALYRMTDIILDKLEYLFQVLYHHIGVPILHSAFGGSKDGTTLSNSFSASSGSTSLVLPQPRVPQLVGETLPSEIYGPLTAKPINIYNGFAIIFVYSLNSLYLEEIFNEKVTNNRKSEDFNETLSSEICKSAYPNPSMLKIMKCIEIILQILQPLNHASSFSNCSHNTSTFIQAFTYQYCKRIYRERYAILNNEFPSYSPNLIYISKRHGLLCRFDDEFVFSIIFPIIEQGVFSKDLLALGRFEDAVKRWIYILPDIILPYIVNIRILPALETTSEVHQLSTALRILTTISPLLVQFMPQIIPRLLELTLQGIDVSDPFKTNHSLTFYSHLFNNLQNIKINLDKFDSQIASEDLYEVLMKIMNKDGCDTGVNSIYYQLKVLYALYNYPVHLVEYAGTSMFDKGIKEIPPSIISKVLDDGKSKLSIFSEDNKEIYGERKENFQFLTNVLSSELLYDKIKARLSVIHYIYNYWIYSFVDKVLELLRNVAKPTKNGGFMSSVDMGVTYSLRLVLSSLFIQCNLVGYEYVIKECYMTIMDWICQNYIPENSKHVSKLLTCMGACNPKIALEICLPKLANKITYSYQQKSMDKHISSNAITYNLPDEFKGTFPILNIPKVDIEDESYIIYYLYLISNLIRYCQDILFENTDSLHIIISLLSNLLLESKTKIFRMALKLQQRLIESLLHIQVIERSIYDRALISDNKDIAITLLLWGFPFFIQENIISNFISRLSLVSDSIYQDNEYYVCKPIWYIPSHSAVNIVEQLIVLNMKIVLRCLNYFKIIDSNFENLITTTSSFSSCWFFINDDMTIQSIKNLTMLNILQRCFATIRTIHKALSPLFPNVNQDSSSKSTLHIPLVAPIEIIERYSPLICSFYEDCIKTILHIFSIYTGVHFGSLNNFDNEYNSLHIDDSNSNKAGIKSVTKNLDSEYTLMAPKLQLGGTDEITFRKKIVKTISQCLNHYYSSLTSLSISTLYNTKFLETTMSWISFTNGISKNSYLMYIPRLYWLKHIQYSWNKRINYSRHIYQFHGYRKDCIYILALLSLGYYHVVRKSAQLSLRECLNSHINSRYPVVEFILYETFASILIYKIMKADGDHINQIGNSPNDSRDIINCNFILSTLNKADIEDYLCNHLKGFAYSIDETTVQRWIWGKFHLLYHFVSLCALSSTLTLTKDTDQLQMISCYRHVLANREFQSIINNIEEPNRDDRFRLIKLDLRLQRLCNHFQLKIPSITLNYDIYPYSSDISEGNLPNFYQLELDNIINRILDILIYIVSNSTQITGKLRLVIIWSLFINGLINQLLNKNSEVRYHLISDDTILKYWDFLWKCIKDERQDVPIQVLASHSIAFLIQSILFEQSLLNRIAGSIDDIQPETIQNIIDNMVNVNHSNKESKQNLGHISSNIGILTYMNDFVTNYVSINIPFPFHRMYFSKDNLSIINVMFFQSILILLYIRNYCKDSNSDNISSQCTESILKVLKEYTSTNLRVEVEKHFTALEIIASIFSISTLNNEMDEFIFKYFSPGIKPILATEFQQVDPNFVFDFMDCVKICLTPYSCLSMKKYFNKEFQYIPDRFLSLNILISFLCNPYRSISIDDNEVDTYSIDIDVLSTFDLTKYLRTYQSGLREITMNQSSSDNLINSPCFIKLYKSGFELLKLTFSKPHNFRQVREEVSNLLHSMIIACNFISGTNENLRSICREFIDKSILPLINNVIQLNPEELENIPSYTEIFLYYCILRELYLKPTDILRFGHPIDINILMNFIASLQTFQIDNDSINLSYNAVLRLLLFHLTYEFNTSEGYKKLQALIDTNIKWRTHHSLRLRIFCIRVFTIIAEYYAVYIANTQLQLKIFNNIIFGLFDQQSEVRQLAKQALSILFRSIPKENYKLYIRVFINWVSNPASEIQDIITLPADLLCNGNGLNENLLFSSGILGLISLILSQPYTVPSWLPEVITFVASNANKKAPGLIKRQIEACIQEFFKTHQDGWDFIHKHKFSSHQLEILDIYKGRPSYFA